MHREFGAIDSGRMHHQQCGWRPLHRPFSGEIPKARFIPTPSISLKSSIILRQDCAQRVGRNSPNSMPRPWISCSPSVTTQRRRFAPSGRVSRCPAIGGIPDPAAATGTEAEEQLAFTEAHRMLHDRISNFVNLPIRSPDKRTLQRRLTEIGAMVPESSQKCI